MSRMFTKTSIRFFLIGCLLFVTACSNDDTADEQVPVNDTSTEENENITSDIKKDDGEDTISDIEKSSEETELTSDFVRSQTSISSIFFRNSTDIGSDISKEVRETLSEFNATESDGGTKLTLPDDILFDFDSDKLRAEADKVIDQLVEVAETTDGDITIIGHTDNHGKDDYNQNLSEQRADAVRQALIDGNVDESRIKAEGKGASEPVASNTNSDGSDNPDGRQKNRRVEMIVQGFNE